MTTLDDVPVREKITSPARRKAAIVPVREITNAASKETYRTEWVPVRPGSQDHERVPSRRADGRYYRDGRKEAV